jgi:AbrB family looped-hinge helix DNA binding protein
VEWVAGRSRAATAFSEKLAAERMRLPSPAERLTISRSIGGHMARTRVSPKFQVVIPKEIRENMDLQVGQELQVVSKGGVITLVPERPLSSLRGFAKGIRTDNIREKKDRM